MTNYEKIKSASIEELSDILCRTHCGYEKCDSCIVMRKCYDNKRGGVKELGFCDWLRQEFDESLYEGIREHAHYIP